VLAKQVLSQLSYTPTARVTFILKHFSRFQNPFPRIFITIGLDLGDRSSSYCVLNEAGEIVLEHKLATTPEAMKQVFGSMPRCRIVMETGTHSPWVSRLLTGMGHEVIVAHAQKVRLIVKSRRKDDRLDARTLARLARIDPELLSPVQHRSAQASCT
jgi:transposase